MRSALAVLAGVVGLAACGSSSLSMRRGDAASRQGQHAQAYVAYRAALFHELRPGSPSAHRAFELAQAALEAWLEAELDKAEGELARGETQAAHDRLTALSHPEFGVTSWEALESKFMWLRPATAPTLLARRDGLLMQATRALWPTVDAEVAAGRWPRAVARARELTARLPAPHPFASQVREVEMQARAHLEAQAMRAGKGRPLFELLAAWAGLEGGKAPSVRYRLRLQPTGAPAECATLVARLMRDHAEGDVPVAVDLRDLRCGVTAVRSQQEGTYTEAYTVYVKEKKCTRHTVTRCTGTDMYGKCIATTNVDTGQMRCSDVIVPETRYRTARRLEEVARWTASAQGWARLSVDGVAVTSALTATVTKEEVGWAVPSPKPLKLGERDMIALLAEAQERSLRQGLDQLSRRAGRMALEVASAAQREGRADDADRAVGEALGWGVVPPADLVAFVAERHGARIEDLTQLFEGRWPGPKLPGPPALPEPDLAGVEACRECLAARAPGNPTALTDPGRAGLPVRGLSVAERALFVGWADTVDALALGGFDRGVVLGGEVRGLGSTGGFTGRTAAELAIGIDGGFGYRLEPLAIGYTVRLGPLRLGLVSTVGVDGVLWGRVSSGLYVPLVAHLAFRPAGYVGLELEGRAIWLLTTDSRQDGSRTLSFTDEASASARLCLGDPDARTAFILGGQAREWRDTTTWTFSLGFGACASGLR